MNRLILLVLLISTSVGVTAKDGECLMNGESEKHIRSLFAASEELYSLLWWESKDSKVINARSFVINGKDSIPIFANVDEAKKQIAGSGLEKDLVGIKPSLLADVLQGMKYAILNPGGSNPVSFETCIVKEYAKKDA